MRHVALVVGLVVLAGAAWGEERAKLALDVVVVVDQPVIGFRVKNVGEVPVEKHPMCENHNRLVMLWPSGMVWAPNSIVDAFGPGAWPIIGAGETASWEMSLEELWRRFPAGEAGTYRLYWEYAGNRSREVFLERRQGKAWQPSSLRRGMKGLATPQVALVRFAEWLDGDGGYEGDLESQLVGRSGGRVDVRSLSELYAARYGFGEMGRRTFGKGEAVGIEASDAMIEEIAKARVEYSDYFEVAVVAGEGWSVRLVRGRQGMWMVDLRSFEGDGKLVEGIKVRTDVTNTLAPRVGRHGSFAEAVGELRERLGEQARPLIRLARTPEREEAVR